MNELIELRKKIKKKKPLFKRQEAKRIRLEVKWRRPKGGQSKLRKDKKGHGHNPNRGYSSPRKIRGLNSLGLKEVKVASLQDLEKVGKEEGIILSGKLGARKRIELLKKIKEMKLTIVNIKDIDAYIKTVEEKLKTKKQEKVKRQERKEKSKKEAEKAAKEAEKKEAQKTEEDKEKEEKEAKRKVLESKTTKTSGGQ